MKKSFFIAIIITLIIIAFAGNYIHQTRDIKVYDLSNRNYFPRISKAISEAKNSVHIVMFEMRYYPNNTNSSENALVQELIKAHERNVSIKVVLEGGEDYLGYDFISKQKQACAVLKNAGISVRFDPEGTTTHAKLLIIDSEIVIIGSTNWGEYALEKNYEASVMIVSKSLADDFEKYFNKIWFSSEDAECLATDEPDEKCMSIADIMSNKDYCDGRLVSAQGLVEDMKTKTSKSGNIYTTFDLILESDSINIFMWGEPELEDGDNITVIGVYRKEKKVGQYSFYNEIEAEEIEATNVEHDNLN